MCPFKLFDIPTCLLTFSVLFLSFPFIANYKKTIFCQCVWKVGSDEVWMNHEPLNFKYDKVFSKNGVGEIFFKYSL
jgi:hypothetical protein